MGAWTNGVYRYKQDGTNDELLGSAIVAFKNELIYNGYTKGIDPSLPVFGDAMRNRVTEFQTDRHLTADGQIGRTTAKEMFRKRIVVTEANYGLPWGTIGKQLLLESVFDPSATGYVDPSDTGIAQINLKSHPDVTRAQALDPAFAIDWAARYVRSTFDTIVTNVNAMKAARAAYNVGTGNATDWLLSNFAASGGSMIGDEDSFERATNYIALVDKQQW